MKKNLIILSYFVMICISFNLAIANDSTLVFKYWPISVGNEWIFQEPAFNGNNWDEVSFTKIEVKEKSSFDSLTFSFCSGISDPYCNKDYTNFGCFKYWVLIEPPSKIFGIAYFAEYSPPKIYKQYLMIDFADTSIMSYDSTITVPAGSFEHCIVFSNGACYAPDIGPITNLIYAKVNGIEYGAYNPPPPTSVEIVKEQTHPSAFRLYQNYPNPFNGSTEIRFNLEEPSEVILSVYNLQGREIKKLIQSQCPAGSHRVIWDGTVINGQIVSSGIYFIKLKAHGFEQTIKAIYVR